MIDFQFMQPAHPARDIWYLLASCTDSDWRKANLDECLKHYYEVFVYYLIKSNIDISCEDFVKEVKDRWAFGLLITPDLMTCVLSPEKRDTYSSWKSLNEFYKWRDSTFSAPSSEDEHPMIVEIKRRLVDLVQEGRDLGFY